MLRRAWVDWTMASVVFSGMRMHHKIYLVTRFMKIWYEQDCNYYSKVFGVYTVGFHISAMYSERMIHGKLYQQRGYELPRVHERRSTGFGN